jgi:hypothetical protein
MYRTKLIQNVTHSQIRFWNEPVQRNGFKVHDIKLILNACDDKTLNN